MRHFLSSLMIATMFIQFSGCCCCLCRHFHRHNNCVPCDGGMPAMSQYNPCDCGGVGPMSGAFVGPGQSSCGCGSSYPQGAETYLPNNGQMMMPGAGGPMMQNPAPTIAPGGNMPPVGQ